MVKVFIFLLFLSSNTLCYLNSQSALRSFFWYQDSSKDDKHGCYGYLQVDSVSTSGSIIEHYSSFWLIYDWWHLRFKMSYMPTIITFRDSKPSVIDRCSDHFSNVEWFTGFKSLVYNDSLIISYDSIRFYFPLLPLGQSYGRYDYFTVDVDDSLDLEFYGAGDSIMVGTFVHKKPDARGAVNILGRNAFIVELTNSNPIRISCIRCDWKYDSLIQIYLQFPLDSLKKDAAWYGIDILDTLSNPPRIKVFDISLSGSQPYTIGQQTDISWKLEGKGEIDSCIITIAYDKMNWSPLGKTALDSIIPWTIPELVTDSTLIKVTALGKHSEKIFSIRDSIPFETKPELKIWGLQYH